MGSRTLVVIVLLWPAVAHAGPPELPADCVDTVAGYPGLNSALVGRARAGDQQALAELDALLRPRLLSFLRARGVDGEDAEDLAQLTLIRIYSKLDQLDNPEAVVAWAMRAAHNLCTDLRRRGGPEVLTTPFRDGDIEEGGRSIPEPSAPVPPDREAARASIGPDLWEQIGVNAADAEIYRLRAQENHTWPQLEALLQRPQAELKARFRRTQSAVAEATERGAALARAVAALPERAREMLTLVEIRRLPVEEAARRMRLSETEARLLLSEARLAALPSLFGRRWTERDLSMVPDPNRDTARLVLLDGLTMREAAERLGIPEGTVKTRVRAARQAINFYRTQLPGYIASLPRDTGRLVTRLYWVDGYTVPEIARLLGRSESTVQEALSVARRAFRVRHQRAEEREEGATREISFPLRITDGEQSNYSTPLTAEERTVSREKLDALTALGWTEPQIREILREHSEEDQRILTLVLFQGMEPREVESYTGIKREKVSDRASRILAYFRELDPARLPPAILRGEVGRALSEAIGWGTRVTDPTQVPQVIANLVDQMAPGDITAAARLVYVEGQTQAAAATSLGITEQVLRQRLHAARARMLDLRYDPDGVARRRQEAAAARARIVRLIDERVPEDLRETARLFFVEGLDRTQVAARLGITVAAAKGRRARLVPLLEAATEPGPGASPSTPD